MYRKWWPKVLVKDNNIKKRWRGYFYKHMNENYIEGFETLENSS